MFTSFKANSAFIAWFSLLIAIGLLCVRIGFPEKPVFDEIHYIPASQAIVRDGVLRNAEHPPLLKLLIGTTMKITASEKPITYRWVSLFGGSLILWLAFFIARSFKLQPPLFVVVTVSTGFFLFLGRVAMLEALWFGFFCLSIGLFTWALRLLPSTQKYLMLLGSGATFGLAMATKWTALLSLPVFGWMLLRSIFRSHTAGPKSGVMATAIQVGCVTVMGAVLSYALVYTWLFYSLNFPIPETLLGFIYSQQTEALRLQALVITPHPNQEAWYLWPLLKTRYWLFFESTKITPLVARGVLFVGNLPLIWGSFLCLIYATYYYLRHRSKAVFSKVYLGSLELGLAGLYGWLIFALVPRKIMYGYYFFPSVTAFAVSLALMAHQSDHFNLRRSARWLIGLGGVWCICYTPFIYGLILPSQWYHSWLLLPPWR